LLSQFVEENHLSIVRTIFIEAVVTLEPTTGIGFSKVCQSNAMKNILYQLFFSFSLCTYLILKTDLPMMKG